MRELTVRIRFTRHSLGNVKAKGKSGRFLLPRSPDGSVLFMPSWHRANMRFAAQVIGKHQDEVGKILWDAKVDGIVRHNNWYRRYHTTGDSRYILHEAFQPGQIVGLNCVVPAPITDEDLWRLLTVAGQYKGLSPWHPQEFGLYDVESIHQRRFALPRSGGQDKNEGEETADRLS